MVTWSGLNSPVITNSDGVQYKVDRLSSGLMITTATGHPAGVTNDGTLQNFDGNAMNDFNFGIQRTPGGPYMAVDDDYIEKVERVNNPGYISKALYDNKLVNPQTTILQTADQGSLNATGTGYDTTHKQSSTAFNDVKTKPTTDFTVILPVKNLNGTTTATSSDTVSTIAKFTTATGDKIVITNDNGEVVVTVTDSGGTIIKKTSPVGKLPPGDWTNIDLVYNGTANSLQLIVTDTDGGVSGTETLTGVFTNTDEVQFTDVNIGDTTSDVPIQVGTVRVVDSPKTPGEIADIVKKAEPAPSTGTSSKDTEDLVVIENNGGDTPPTATVVSH